MPDRLRDKTPSAARRARVENAKRSELFEASLKEVSDVFAERELLAQLMTEAAAVLGQAAEVAGRLHARTDSGFGRDLSLSKRTGLREAFAVVTAAREHLMRSVRLGRAANELQRKSAARVAECVAKSVQALDEAVQAGSVLSAGDGPWRSSMRAIEVARRVLVRDADRYRASSEIRKAGAVVDLAGDSREFV